ncbi:hypothetical protein KQH42_05115 [Streptomyces sp. CHA1]|nr:hypothetical protein [Streptomyces sp. G11C]MCO6700071.1 hypothetical protein [Streptomyces sp. CHB9.2]MCO6706219.1 hypothetical protein [Streptomyces sp. CHA3]MCO6711956.1 hypothetical protein [Streptomyces sp. CHB19.2]MCO6718389.1 hypothetical protein [Streptomyces sp. Vc714c-19]MCO6723985.1 hypothetical protein [Streptomyces sp. CHA16]MCO6729931.1 hypothetical protein [Streptomyces sp. EL9]MCO6735601.1 hypothetical protein [Streptomyces sp. CHA15]MCO6741711.1 hypothetical protein [Str
MTTGNRLGLALLVVAVLVALGLLGWAGFCLARWYRADAETRASLRQARRLRWGWKRLAPMLGLAVKDATPTVLQQYGPQEQPPKPRVLVPHLRTRADAFGVTVTADALPQVGLSAWQDASEGLCDAWGMRRIRISQPKPGVIVARGFRREPLEAVIRSPLLGPDGSPVCRPGQFVSTDDVLLGWDEDGTPIVLNLAYSAHALVAGLTRSGKSITVNTLLAYASLMRDVRLIVIDPNLGAVAPWWRTAYKVSDAIHPDEPTEILRWVREEMQRRERLFWSGRTDRITEFSPEPAAAARGDRRGGELHPPPGPQGPRTLRGRAARHRQPGRQVRHPAVAAHPEALRRRAHHRRTHQPVRPDLPPRRHRRGLPAPLPRRPGTRHHRRRPHHAPGRLHRIRRRHAQPRPAALGLPAHRSLLADQRPDVRGRAEGPRPARPRRLGQGRVTAASWSRFAVIPGKGV